MAKEITLGGGKLYLSKVTTYTGATPTVYGTEFEVGYVKNFKLTVNADKITATNHDGQFEQDIDEVVSKLNLAFSFDTSNTSATNLAMALLGTVTAAGISQDEEVELAVDATARYKVRFASDYVKGNNKDFVAYRASIAATGDVALQAIGAEASVSFEGAALVDGSVTNTGGESQYAKITYRGTATA